MVDLSSLGGNDRSSIAADVNDRGQVIGFSSTTSGGLHAFSWTAQGGMVDLEPLRGTSSFPAAVNDPGEVVGVSSSTNGDMHAFLWVCP